MTPEEKRKVRFKRWFSPEDVRFKDPEAEKKYKEEVNRFIDTISLQEPVRGLVILPMGFLPLYDPGVTLKDVMHDYYKLKYGWLKLIEDFEVDGFLGPVLTYSPKVFEAIE